MADLSPGSEFAGYRIESVAGQGGMGVVLRATQLALDRPVALKVIVPELADDLDFRARFKRESLLAASIDHTNVIPVYEAGESDGWLFISMRWVEGSDVRSLIARAGSLDPERAVTIVERVGAALDAAHNHGLVHRDVKPANVLTTGGAEEHVYLTDFGLTKRAASAGGLTHTGHFVGTADYAAPEQIRGERADARADVYALGCMLYQAVTGRVPFDRDSEVAKMYAHLNDPPPAISQVAPHLPVALDAVVERALAKDPADRFPSAGDLARAARAALAGTAVVGPERSLATGVAAPALAATEAAPVLADPTVPAATIPLGATAPQSGVRSGAGPPPPPPPRRRATPAAIAAVGLCVVAAAAGVLAVTGVFSGDGDEKPGQSGGGEAATGSGGNGATAPEISVFPAGNGPDGIAVSGKTVFVTNAAGDTLTRLDADTGRRIGAPVQVGRNPDGVAVDEGVAWVVNTDDGTVSQLKVGSDSPSTVQVGALPEGVALGEQLVWVANTGDGTVSRVDRASPQVLGGPIPVGERPVGVVVDDGVVWVANSRSDSVSRINSSTAEPLGDQIPVGDEPRGIAGGLGFIWVVNKGDDSVTRLDPATAKPVGNPIKVGDTPKEVAVGLGAAWVANTEANTVSRIDPQTGKVVGAPIPVGGLPVGIAVGAGAVWVANNGDDTVTRIRP